MSSDLGGGSELEEDPELDRGCGLGGGRGDRESLDGGLEKEPGMVFMPYVPRRSSRAAARSRSILG